MWLFRCLSMPSLCVHFAVCQFIDDTFEPKESPLYIIRNNLTTESGYDFSITVKLLILCKCN